MAVEEADRHNSVPERPTPLYVHTNERNLYESMDLFSRIATGGDFVEIPAFFSIYIPVPELLLSGLSATRTLAPTAFRRDYSREVGIHSGRFGPVCFGRGARLPGLIQSQSCTQADLSSASASPSPRLGRYTSLWILSEAPTDTGITTDADNSEEATLLSGRDTCADALSSSWFTLFLTARGALVLQTNSAPR
jgi:hypothetical protein